MFSRRSELKIPDAAKADPQAREILCIWLAAGGQHVSFKTGVWDDPASRLCTPKQRRDRCA
jgi:hypothetical protein